MRIVPRQLKWSPFDPPFLTSFNMDMPNFPSDPSPEQLMAMLQNLQAAGHNLDEISPDLSELMRNVKKEKGQPTDDVAMEEVTPEPRWDALPMRTLNRLINPFQDAVTSALLISMFGEPELSAHTHLPRTLGLSPVLDNPAAL